jgi:NAD-dependent dihydropyrimidine dehydrogenase PreA subunit
MRIRSELCAGCIDNCSVYCPTGAIYLDGSVAAIDRDKCVECYACHRISCCPNGSFEPEELSWPRDFRRAMSDPITVDNRTGVSGRGTAEMKTNDVTGRIRYGHFGIGVELGRPGVGTAMRDVEKVCMALAPHISFEPKNPVTYVMQDAKTGKLREDILGEFVLSAIVEGDVPVERLEVVLDALRRVADQVDTVFSVGLSSRVYPDGSLVFKDRLERAGYTPYRCGKTNVGLAKPAFVEVAR